MEPLKPFITGVPEETLQRGFEPDTYNETISIPQVNENGGGPTSREVEAALESRETKFWLTSATLRVYEFNGDSSATFTAKLKLTLNDGQIAVINPILETNATGIPDAEYSENIIFANPIFFNSKEKLAGVLSIDAQGADYGYCKGEIILNGIKQTS